MVDDFPSVKAVQSAGVSDPDEPLMVLDQGTDRVGRQAFPGRDVAEDIVGSPGGQEAGGKEQKQRDGPFFHTSQI